MAIINVILSGGVGSRLWPLSRKSKPKQYISLFDGCSLFELTVNRNKHLVDKQVVVGSIDNYRLSQAEFVKASVDYSEIIEATSRNTAASIAFAAFFVQPDDILVVTPSDHVVEGDEYNNVIKTAVELAKEGYIVTFGAIPTRVETGYGYIEKDADNNVLSFKEKPDAETASFYVASNKFLWNSGMFAFQAKTYLEELEKYSPEIFTASKETFAKIKDGFLPLNESLKIPNKSVDYAVMEQSKKIKVVPFTFQWNDLGSFDAIWAYLSRTKGISDKNLTLGSSKHVEFLGVEDLIYVETSDAILIINRANSQEVKNIYERLEKDNPKLLE